jgi:predicted anti-sigma-YlaC factor YlaD
MAIMDCDNIKAIAPGYINHTATETEISAVEEHLCICNDCRQYLGTLMDNPPEQHKPAVQKEIKQETPSVSPVLETKEKRQASSFGILEYAILGISIIVCIFFIYLLIKK